MWFGYFKGSTKVFIIYAMIDVSDLIRKRCNDDIYHIEIHIKEMEDLYIFDKETTKL